MRYVLFQDDEEPPFNFQGMLRKTKHQRASMKRSKGDSNNNDNGSHDTGNVVFDSGTPDNRKSLQASDADFDFDLNDNVPVALPRKEIAPVPRDRQLSFGESTLLGGDTALENIGTYIQEEIQPGVILEGYAVEL